MKLSKFPSRDWLLLKLKVLRAHRERVCKWLVLYLATY